MNVQDFETCLNQLNAVRNDMTLLENYRFQQESNESKQAERLALNIAMYNDFKLSDYSIAKFLFDQELMWRKDKNYYNNAQDDVDNLYFSAWLLTHYQNIENIFDFYELKFIDFDSQCGVDSEFIYCYGIKAIKDYLKKTHHSKSHALTEFLNEDIESYSDEEINAWQAWKKDYFHGYEYQ